MDESTCWGDITLHRALMALPVHNIAPSRERKAHTKTSLPAIFNYFVVVEEEKIFSL